MAASVASPPHLPPHTHTAIVKPNLHAPKSVCCPPSCPNCRALQVNPPAATCKLAQHIMYLQRHPNLHMHGGEAAGLGSGVDKPSSHFSACGPLAQQCPKHASRLTVPPQPMHALLEKPAQHSRRRLLSSYSALAGFVPPHYILHIRGSQPQSLLCALACSLQAFG